MGDEHAGLESFGALGLWVEELGRAGGLNKINLNENLARKIKLNENLAWKAWLRAMAGWWVK